MNLQRLSINVGRKSIISIFDVLHKRSQSTAVTTYKSQSNRQSMNTAGFQFLSHKNYYPLMIDSITHQLDLIEKFVSVIEQITNARQSYSMALKNICQSFKESVENVENVENNNDSTTTTTTTTTNNKDHEILDNLWHIFIEKSQDEAGLHENVIQETKAKVVIPLQCIVKQRRQQISRLKAFRTLTDFTLKECSEKVVELHGNYAEMYRIHRELLQTKSIKDLLNAHNSYVLQLHMTNAMKAYYHNLILPQLMQEFESIVRENTVEFVQIFDYFCSIHANMFEQLICNNNGVQFKAKEISPDTVVSAIVHNLNKNQNPTHWQLIEYLPPDCDCPEILCSDQIIVDNLVKGQLQEKIAELKRQFAELSSFMQQNINIVDTLKTLEKRFDLETETRHTNLNMHDDIYRKEDEIRKARIALAGIEIQLKIIDMKKEGSGDLKSVTTSGSQNIKGLWKRAFHSLRKDKTDKDQIKRKENGSQSTDPQTLEGEVDPVYHLLRCAASKSQTTAIATTGLVNCRTNLKTKSSVPDTPIPSSSEFGNFVKTDYNDTNLYPGSLLLRKASTSVTLKQNESYSRRPDEYSLEGDSNYNIITNNNNKNNQSNREIEGNTSRFNEHKSIKSNVLVSSNLKLTPQNPLAEQQIVNINEAELAYEQHKRMNPRQKTSRTNQKSSGFLTEDYPQTSFTTDCGYESEPKSFICTDEVKSHKQFTGYNQKSFSPAIRNSCEKMNTSNRMRMMSMDENEDDADDNDDDSNNNNNDKKFHYYTKDNDNYKGQNASYLRSENSYPSISQQYIHNTNATYRKPYCHDEMPQCTTTTTTTQLPGLQEKMKKNPLLSTKSFSLDVPRFDQPNDSNLIGSGGSSPGRYSEGFRKSSVVKYHPHLPPGISPSSVSPRINEPMLYTHTAKNIPYEETHMMDMHYSTHMNTKDLYSFDALYSTNINERSPSTSGRRRISPLENYSSRPRLVNTNRILPKPIESTYERNPFTVKRNFTSNQRNEPNLRF
ncbi:unnamed protein product [Schistosoma turkestanicum]|nr:unnamed protein product [Schistosoma turkestanicum]